ncbi:Alba [Musa troglodytarum]|uniref:Alba n=1 Tax=Musa troglodytarum TaxID=320322 RepID=A0A9E7HCG3_9LILI|nr:Alba [Musa troglodytarum]
MDRYQKVEKPRPESAIINENEIRITSQGIIRNYVSYATSLLQERRGREIVLKAMGQAISKAVAIAEIIKKRFPGLYQDTAISSVSITDVWEPIEEGLFGDDTSCFNDFNIIVNQRAKQEFPWFPYMSSSQSTSRDINSPSSLNSNSSFNQNKHKVNLMKIHMYEGVVELEVEEEEGVGEEDTVGLLNMTPIKVDMTTIKEDMAIIKVDMDITKADMVIIKEDMVDTVTNTIMVDGTLTGAVVVDVVEVAGTIEVEDMEGEEVVEGLVGEVMDEDEEGWMAVGEGTKSSTLMLVEKDLEGSILWFWKAINERDRVDSALKDMAVVMKQQDRAEEAVEAIKSFRHLCSNHSHESLDNLLIDLYKKCGRVEEQIAMLKQKLRMIYMGKAFNGKTTKTARCHGKKFQVSIKQEIARLLGNLGWAYMQQGNYMAAEAVYRKSQMIEPNANNGCNLGVCLINQGRYDEARSIVTAVLDRGFSSATAAAVDRKALQRANKLLAEIDQSISVSEMTRRLGEEMLKSLDIMEEGWTPSKSKRLPVFEEISPFRDQMAF